jgi:hypothetical protein
VRSAISDHLRSVNGQVRAADLAGDAINSDKVADGSLTGPDLADRTIGGQKVGTETLSGANVADGSLFGADIANDSLTGSDIATHAVGSSELDPAAFEPSDIAPKSLSDPRLGIAPNAVQGDEVSDNTLTGADINESTLDTPAAAFLEGGRLVHAALRQRRAHDREPQGRARRLPGPREGVAAERRRPVRHLPDQRDPVRRLVRSRRGDRPDREAGRRAPRRLG